MQRIFRTLILAAILLSLNAAEALKPHDQAAIQRAMASDAQAAERVKGDENRPAYHVIGPANWMNDPNGPIFHNGYWHMFYQHNPYGDGWGSMHWGHVRSRDLAHWEHLPIALWPSKEVGEDHVFSGCATIRADGKPAILYTSIGRGQSATDYAEQWLALGDNDLLEWRKVGAALTPAIHGGTKIWDWRDPFLFKFNDVDYLVLGGNLNHGKGGEAVVNLYRATDSSLLHWEYLGVLFKHPDPKAVNIECPNFFELDGKWVLILSPHRRVEYFIGTFDGKKFTSEKHGLLDASDNFYAPNCTTAPDGRRILWGWIRGFKGGQGWNGCHTLPRVLKVAHGELIQEPAAELQKLRARRLLTLPQKALSSETPVRIDTDSTQLEINATFHGPGECGVTLFKTKTDPGLKIAYQNGELRVGGKTAPHILPASEPLQLHVFLDHSVVEVYANGQLCLTTIVYPKTRNAAPEFFGTEHQNLTAELFELSSAW